MHSESYHVWASTKKTPWWSACAPSWWSPFVCHRHPLSSFINMISHFQSVLQHNTICCMTSHLLATAVWACRLNSFCLLFMFMSWLLYKFWKFDTYQIKSYQPLHHTAMFAHKRVYSVWLEVNAGSYCSLILMIILYLSIYPHCLQL